MKHPLPKTLLSLVPVLVLVALLALNIGIFGADSILGASQVALLASSGVAVLIATLAFKTPWKDFEAAIKQNFSDIAGATLILFLIGGVSGTWTMSGIVPAFIYYGVQLINPKVFLLTACLICAVVSVMTGSSWTTIATIGVALLGIGKAEGFSDGMIAGAIISGAYFGDKISPLSDTTVMASSVNQVPLFTHIRYMFFTTVPSMVITLIVFTILGLSHDGADASRIDLYTSVLADKFHITPWLMLVPVLTVFLILKRMPALPVLAISVLAAALPPSSSSPISSAASAARSPRVPGRASCSPAPWKASITPLRWKPGIPKWTVSFPPAACWACSTPSSSSSAPCATAPACRPAA